MIFVTLGSQKFQFNRLLKKIDELIEKKSITDEVFAQIGYSDYQPQHYKHKEFLSRDEFAAMEGKADIVITHGGTGAIIGAVKKEKKVIAVPRLAEYGEHVDDHQLQLIGQFDEMGIIEACYDLKQFERAYQNVNNSKYLAYASNTKMILESIDEFLRKQ